MQNLTDVESALDTLDVQRANEQRRMTESLTLAPDGSWQPQSRPLTDDEAATLAARDAERREPITAEAAALAARLEAESQRLIALANRDPLFAMDVEALTRAQQIAALLRDEVNTLDAASLVHWVQEALVRNDRVELALLAREGTRRVRELRATLADHDLGAWRQADRAVTEVIAALASPEQAQHRVKAAQLAQQAAQIRGTLHRRAPDYEQQLRARFKL